MSAGRKERVTLVLAVVTALVLALSVPGSLRGAWERGGFHIFSREFLEDLPKRLFGPGRFRFLLQPVVAMVLGWVAGRAEPVCVGACQAGVEGHRGLDEGREGPHERARCYSDAVRERTESPTGSATRVPYVWDYDIDGARFRALLEGREVLGRLDRDWAAARLLDHASWREIRRLMSLGDLVMGWPAWRHRVRSASRRRGFDFLVEWLPCHHPELL